MSTGGWTSDFIRVLRALNAGGEPDVGEPVLVDPLHFEGAVTIDGTPTFNVGKAGSVRQTVVESQVDVDGLPDAISIGSGLACDLDATADPVLINFAAGHGEGGDIDYIGKISTDVASAWSGLLANARNFLHYIRDATTGAISYGSVANLPPIYGRTYNEARGVGKSLLHFEGADASTDIDDENADVTWTAAGHAQIDTAEFKFGTSSLLLDGTTDYITQTGLNLVSSEGFKMDIWVRTTSIATLRWLYFTDTAFHIALGLVATTGKLALYLGNGAGWTIANNVQSTNAIAIDTWYHIRIQWDGATYKVYIDGAEEISVTSSIAFADAGSELRIGAGNTGLNGWIGWVDEFKYEVGPQTLGAFTKPTEAYGGLPADGEHWFDLTRFVMKYWDDALTQWIDSQRVFGGECVTDGSSVTSVINYALQGKAEVDQIITAITTSYELSHNIGTDVLSIDLFLECILGEWGFFAGNRVRLVEDYHSNLRGATIDWRDNTVRVSIGHFRPLILRRDATTGGFATSGYWKVIAELTRGF